MRPSTKAAKSGYATTLFSRPRPLPLYAYYDGPGIEAAPRLANLTWISLDEVAPWASAFVRRNSRFNSTVQKAYQARRFTCVVISDSALCKDILTAYKVAAGSGGDPDEPGGALMGPQ